MRESLSLPESCQGALERVDAVGRSPLASLALHKTTSRYVLLDRDAAESFATALFRAAGATEVPSRVVARHLVESDCRGVPSHGLLRVTQYLAEIETGEIDPAALPTRERASGARVWLDGNRCFGPVAGSAAVDEAVAVTAVAGMGVVTVRHTGHAGRIGDYVERAAHSGLVAVAYCSGPRSGHRVAPFGATEGRLSTNPIAFAFPTPSEPIVADFSTSAVPEGVVRRLHELGLPVPEGALQDPAGRPTTDAGVLYATPPGTILPLGGSGFGHKGFALGLLVEVLATLLAGDETPDAGRYGNNLALITIGVDAGFRARAGRLANYVRSAAPADPARPVLMPGDPERAFAEREDGVRIDRSTWAALAAAAFERDVPLPASSDQ
jgi:LDH2 family malate/lactate/ureidoglycolate dehydrogenase